MPKRIDMPSDDKAKLLLDAVEDRKAVDPSLIDLRGKTLMTDYLLVCTGTSDVHIRAISDSAQEKAEIAHLARPRIEGQSLGEWILIDFGDVIVHVMSEEARDRYRLEQFWTTPQPKGALPPTPESVASGDEEDEDFEDDENVDDVFLDEEDEEDAAFFEDSDAEVEPVEEDDEDLESLESPKKPGTDKA